jgi:outer membrane biosynthesis protein TonB
MCGALVFFVLYAPALAVAEPVAEEDELELEFEPGALVKLGKEIPEDVKVVVEETRVAEEVEVVEETITKEEEPPPEPPEEKVEEEEKPKIVPKDKPDPNKKKDVKIADKNQEKNTPYDDLPTVTDPRGDPFGDPKGWADQAKDGDPFATAVMKELNNLKIGTYAAQAKKGTFEFTLQVCQDGKLKVLKKAGDDAELWQQISHAVSQLKIPLTPKWKQMLTKSCQSVKARFIWQDGKVRV